MRKLLTCATATVLLMVTCGGQTPATGPAPAVSAPAAASAAAVDTGKAFYTGKTITFVSPDKPGGQSDAMMRAIAPLIEKALGATIQITNVSQGGTIPGQNLAAAAKPDGLTIGVLHVSKDVYQEAIGETTVDFPLDSVETLGSIPAPQNLLVASPTSSIKTIQDFLHSTTTVNVLTTGGSGAMSTRALIAAYGANAKIVTGYDSAANLIQGFLRGDGPVTDSAAEPLAPLVLGGKARPILAVSAIAAGKLQDALKGVPTLRELYEKEPPASADGKKLLELLMNYRETPETWLFAPKGTPADRVATLRAAVKVALSDPTTSQQLADQGIAPGYVSWEEAVADIHKMQAAAPIITKYYK